MLIVVFCFLVVFAILDKFLCFCAYSDELWCNLWFLLLAISTFEEGILLLNGAYFWGQFWHYKYYNLYINLHFLPHCTSQYMPLLKSAIDIKFILFYNSQNNHNFHHRFSFRIMLFFIPNKILHQFELVNTSERWYEFIWICLRMFVGWFDWGGCVVV